MEIGGALVVLEIGDGQCLGGAGDWRWVVPETVNKVSEEDRDLDRL